MNRKDSHQLSNATVGSLSVHLVRNSFGKYVRFADGSRESSLISFLLISDFITAKERIAEEISEDLSISPKDSTRLELHAPNQLPLSLVELPGFPPEESELS